MRGDDVGNVQIILEKKCTKCGEVKPATFEYFAKHDKCLYGVNSICKECVKLQYRENRDERLKQVKAYYHENKERIQEKQKAYREKNRDVLLEYSRNYYKENSEELNQKSREHYQENRDEILEYKKMYREENREKVLEQGRQHYHRKGKYTEAKWRKENPERVRKDRKSVV